jgi:hypothetical protein
VPLFFTVLCSIKVVTEFAVRCFYIISMLQYIMRTVNNMLHFESKTFSFQNK